MSESTVKIYGSHVAADLVLAVLLLVLVVVWRNGGHGAVKTGGALTRSAVSWRTSVVNATLCIVFDPELRWLTVMQDASLHKTTINHCFPEKIGDAGPSRVHPN